MKIPDSFARKASRIFGHAGPAWVESLPSIVAWCQDAWELRDLRPVRDLSINLVCYAHCPAHGEVVLKIQGPHGERLTEMEALRAYAGRHACALLRCDRPRAAMLLERLRPGDTLRTLRDRDDQLRIGTRIMAALPIPPTGVQGLPTYRDWMTQAFSRMERDEDPDPTMRMLMATAQELYAEIGADEEPPLLLHGDLHHDNILANGDGHWKVIDPQGVMGAGFLECGRFLQNHVIPDDGELDPDETTRAIAFVADRLGQPSRRIAAALFLLHLLSVCWSFEMKDEPGKLRLQTRQCSILLDLVRRAAISRS